MTEYYRPDYTPEWFHLENYEPLKDMTREDIAENIHCRKLFVWMRTNSADFDDYQYAFKELLDVTRNANRPKDDSLLSCVKPLNYLHLQFILEDIHWSKASCNIAFKNHIDQLQNMPSEWFEPDTHSDGHRYCWNDKWTDYEKGFDEFNALTLTQPLEEDWEAITVYIDQSDEKIISDFTEWLQKTRQQREQMNVKHHIKEVERFKQKEKAILERLSDNAIYGERGLINSCVIPCMDLILWGMWNNFEYTNAQLGDMLFPLEDINRPDKIRKTVKPQAIKYLRTEAYKNIL